MMRQVLITGAAGFIGRHVARIFSESGYVVTGMGWGKFHDFSTWGLSSWYECDVCLETLCELSNKPDVIVHCAGGSSVGYSVEHPRQDFCLTVDTTSHVLEYIRLHSPQTRLVYPSSAAVYGNVEHLPIMEDATINPISPYGTHKAISESLCAMYAQKYQLSVAVVRLFSIFGSGLRKQLLWDACNKILKGNAVFFGTGEEVRDWLHVTDAAKLLHIASDVSSYACPIINGGCGHGVTVRNILSHLVEDMHSDLALQFSAEKKEGDPEGFIAEISLAESYGWHPEVSWKEGVSEYAAWFLECR